MNVSLLVLPPDRNHKRNLKEEIRYNPENLDDAAEELIAIFVFQQKQVEGE